MLQDSRFEVFFELLKKRNAEFNLTAIVEREEVWLKHFADSIAAEPFLQYGASVIDVGSGAGFPGIPLKIVRDDISLCLVESIGKKAGFLREAVQTLCLKNTQVANLRAEDLPKNQKYDCGVARAVAKTATLCEYILPFVKIGGIMIAYKAKDAEQEVKDAEFAINALGGRLEQIKNVRLGEMERKLVIIRKIKETPSIYPRRGNKPKLSPLGL